MNDLGTTALGPPAPAAGFPSHSGRQAGQVRKFTRAPSLELVHHFVRIVVGADDKMNVIGPNIESIRRPATEAAMIADRLIHQVPLLSS